MTADRFSIDSNVLICTQEAADPAKHERASWMVDASTFWPANRDGIGRAAERTQSAPKETRDG